MRSKRPQRSFAPLSSKPPQRSFAPLSSKPPQRSFAHTAVTVLWCVFTVLVAVLFFAERYLMDNWSDLSADELVYHLKSSLDGTNPEMIRSAVLHYGLPAAALSILLIVTQFLLRRRPRYRIAFMAAVTALGLAGLLFLKTELDKRINLTNYVRWMLAGSESDFIADNYVAPGDVRISFPQKKRNLLFLFLESAEVTYADPESGGAFAQNVIPELTALAEENEDFSGEDTALNGGISLPGSTWTMGAMFAMATGAPLKVPINGNNIRDEEQFFPGMQSLGTILQDQGYRQELLIGSKAFFGGRDVFYRGHGGFDIKDYDYAIKNGRIPQDYQVFWGYEDEKLFAFAREDLLELAADGRPFNLTMLTVDTHFEDGYRCRLCRDDFGEQYADAFACSSRQTADFVKWVQQQDFYQNTTIVICGDHPTMDVDFCSDVPDDYQRKTFVAVINGDAPEQGAGRRAHREYSTMDLFPTTLAAMNVRIEGDRLGLGTNLYSDEKTIIEKYGLVDCETELLMPSAFMEEMSGSRITEELLEEIAGYVTAEKEIGDDGELILSLYKLGEYLNYMSVKKMELVVRDTKSGREKTYVLPPVFYSADDENDYYFRAVHDLDGADPDDIEAVFYLTTEEFKHYKIAEMCK